MNKSRTLTIKLDPRSDRILRDLVAAGHYYTLTDVLIDGLKLVAQRRGHPELPLTRARPPRAERKIRSRKAAEPVQ
jgi:Arc/MetJ-type ribon-helix-helix transcriptional regulator